MGVIINWPQGYDTVSIDKSRHAGAAVISAIEAAMRLLRGYELPDDWQPERAHEAAKELARASELYKELEERANDRPVHLAPAMRRALAAALACSDAIGRSGFHLATTVLDPIDSAALSLRTIMRFARLATHQISGALSRLEPKKDAPAMGRRIAADLALLQLIGVMFAELLQEYASFSQLIGSEL